MLSAFCFIRCSVPAAPAQLIRAAWRITPSALPVTVSARDCFALLHPQGSFSSMVVLRRQLIHLHRVILPNLR